MPPTPLPHRRRGLILAAAQSGAGKTLVSLALCRALSQAGQIIAPFKVGPDYLDPQFLSAAAGSAALNLDPWAMRTSQLHYHLAHTSADALCLVEGVMGLFDGPGSAAALAKQTGWPILLVLDAGRSAQTLGALAWGLSRWDPQVRIAGVLANRVGSERHRTLVAEGLAQSGLPLLACLPSKPELRLASRHLGLVQAEELAELEAFLEQAAGWIEAAVDLDALTALAQPSVPLAPDSPRLAYPSGRVAVARDAAFRFAYPHWARAETELLPFSPLGNEAPDPRADFIFLPGGYPELHARQLSQASQFGQGMRAAAQRGVPIYGECGGYMVLGEQLEDAEGKTWPQLGLLGVSTSFAKPRRTLGYRQMETLAPVGGWLRAGQTYRGHEFHYAQVRRVSPNGQPLFAAEDAQGQDLGTHGLVDGSVAGSFLHLIA